jgi:TonB family protein
MADLNDDIKKYLRGELSPAEMHALEKKALNDPFLQDALEGAVQLDSDAFDSDIKNLRSSLNERVSIKGKTISLWVWPARIAAGLILVALSTFVIVKLTGNKPEGDLALKQAPLSSADDNGNDAVATDSATLSRDSQGEPAKSGASTPSANESEVEESKRAPDDVGPSASTANADEKSQAAKEKDDQQVARTTDAVSKEQPVAAAEEVEQDAETPIKGQTEGIKLSDDDQKRRVAATAPESRAKGLGGFTTSKVIRGRVESVDGVPLPGVNVMFKNTNIGTVTDGSGNYQLNYQLPVANDSSTLVFSFIGFSSTEVDAGEKTQLNVQLSEDVSQLSEVVVVGYGAEKKSDDAPETLELANPYGGRRAYKQYLEKSIQYPEQALAENIEGKVTIQFTVESSGQLSDFKVLKGIGHGCEEEVIRLVKQGPRWNPTRRNTESLRDRVKVRMKFTLPKK